MGATAKAAGAFDRPMASGAEKTAPARIKNRTAHAAAWRAAKRDATRLCSVAMNSISHSTFLKRSFKQFALRLIVECAIAALRQKPPASLTVIPTR